MYRQIHEHEVLKMMLQSDQVYTRDELISDIICNFGENARFYTCSTSNLDAVELVEKLDRDGNFLIISEGFLRDPAV